MSTHLSRDHRVALCGASIRLEFGGTPKFYDVPPATVLGVTGARLKAWDGKKAKSGQCLGCWSAYYREAHPEPHEVIAAAAAKLPPRPAGLDAPAHGGPKTPAKALAAEPPAFVNDERKAPAGGGSR